LNTQGQTLDDSFATMESFKKHIINQFDGCLVKDEHKDYVHFHVTNPTTPWAYLFSTMESAKDQFPAVSDYSVSETTLEQVFLSFAKEQRKFVHQVVIDKFLNNHEAPEDLELYFCGPPLMNQAVIKMADDWGIPDENVRFDDFGG
jgi:Na+-transporting NADH:ubiquinone oxidoreductase subunit NqrF